MTTIQPELEAAGGAGAGDDFVAEILTRRRRRLPVLTAILVLAVAAGGAFIAGAEVQKHYGESSSSAPRAAPALPLPSARWPRASGPAAVPAARPLRRRRGSGRRHGRHRDADQGVEPLRDRRDRQHRARAHVACFAGEQDRQRHRPDDSSRRLGDGHGRPGEERQLHGDGDHDRQGRQWLARSRRLGVAARRSLAIVPLALLAAGCGGSSSSSGTPATTTTRTGAPRRRRAGRGVHGVHKLPQAARDRDDRLGGFGRRPRRCVRRETADPWRLRPVGGSGARGGALLRAEPDRRPAEGVHGLP